MNPLQPNTERVILWLLDSDPDEVVSNLQITTQELLVAFPDHLQEYIEREFGGPDDEQDEGEEVVVP